MSFLGDHKASVLAQANTAMETTVAAELLSRLGKLSLQEIYNNPRKPIRILIVDEGVELAVSKQKQRS